MTLSFRLSMKQLNIDIEVVPSSTAAVSPSDHHVLLLVMAPSITLNHLRPISHIHPVSKLPSHVVLSKPRYVLFLLSRSHCMFNIDFFVFRVFYCLPLRILTQQLFSNQRFYTGNFFENTLECQVDNPFLEHLKIMFQQVTSKFLLVKPKC